MFNIQFLSPLNFPGALACPTESHEHGEAWKQYVQEHCVSKNKFHFKDSHRKMERKSLSSLLLAAESCGFAL